MAGRRRAEEVDHISHLPDAITHRIFSFLPFKDVVKTSVLSKQWRFAWTSTPYVDLSPSRGVVPLISRARSLCTATKIEKFHLKATVPDICIPTELDQWFRFATARKVEDVSLAFGYWYRGKQVPQILCDCASLANLRVSNCIFSWDSTIHWPSLKKLRLHDVPLDNDKIMKILSGCPVLESLTLRSSLRSSDLRIDSRSLRELVIEADYIRSLDISAPNLLSLRLSGAFVPTGFGPNGVSSLAEAELNFDKPTVFRGDFPDRLKFLLEQLQHVAKITIGSWCLEVLSAAEAKGMPHLSSRWRNIVVYTAVCKRDLLGMAHLLQSSPLLERLVICNPKSNKFTFKNEDFPELGDFDEKQFWCSQKELCCVANHLKRVDIVGFEFDNEKSKFLLALAEFLLEEADGLEKMIINVELSLSGRAIPIDPRDLWDFHGVIHLQKGCRRASRNVEVRVDYRHDGLPYELFLYQYLRHL